MYTRFVINVPYQLSRTAVGERVIVLITYLFEKPISNLYKN